MNVQLLRPRIRQSRKCAGPGVPWFGIDPTLAFVNEPPPGGNGCNVTVENGASPLELIFRTVVTVHEGEELFVDYGVAPNPVLYNLSGECPSWLVH